MSPGTLSSRRDFDHVWRAGTRARRNGVVAAVVSTAPGAERVGVTARAPSAVVRNRIKRRLRSAVVLCDTGGMDAVVSGDESVAQMPWQDLIRHMKGALASAGRGLR